MNTSPWIPLDDERKPDDQQECLVWFDPRLCEPVWSCPPGPLLARWSEARGEFMDWRSLGHRVTHWQPISAPGDR